MENHIPKVIHYCWFGGKPLPKMAKKCIKSWKKYLPDYEIKQWDESNFNVNIIPYTAQAYEAKKYAFVSDYARFWILYNYGGLYFDTDVEIIRPMDDIIATGSFMGCEKEYISPGNPTSLCVNPGLGIGASKGTSFYKDVLDLYMTLRFINENGSQNLTTIVEYVSNILYSKGMVNTGTIQKIDNIHIYPKEYFCPLTPTLLLNITENTKSIHHFEASWETHTVKLRKKIKRLLGYKAVKYIQPIANLIHQILKK